MTGSQFDNDLNTYLLHSYFRLDAYASRNIANGLKFSRPERICSTAI